MSQTGLVFDISQGCVDDGPGLRTVVFLKGCALGCPWCQNPEGLSPKPEIGFDAERCLDCGRCAAACPDDLLSSGREWRKRCRGCGQCAAVCPSGGRQLLGRRYRVDELVAELLTDGDYFEGTGGGVTFSGGEPLLQADFVLACAKALRAEGIHVAVQTAGGWPTRLAPQLAEAADLVLFDLKHADPDKLRATLGPGCRYLLPNLSALLARDVELEIRLTLIPGFNAEPHNLAAIAELLAQQVRLPPVRLQPLHRLAAAKAARFGAVYHFAATTPVVAAEIAAAARVLGEHDITVLRD